MRRGLYDPGVVLQYEADFLTVANDAAGGVYAWLEKVHF
jgi:hypothetical protein